jgi:hypothetical protein
MWVLARRAYYARDYTTALTWLRKITPEPQLRKLHAWLVSSIPADKGLQ